MDSLMCKCVGNLGVPIMKQNKKYRMPMHGVFPFRLSPMSLHLPTQSQVLCSSSEGSVYSVDLAVLPRDLIPALHSALQDMRPSDPIAQAYGVQFHNLFIIN